MNDKEQIAMEVSLLQIELMVLGAIGMKHLAFPEVASYQADFFGVAAITIVVFYKHFRVYSDWLDWIGDSDPPDPDEFEDTEDAN